MVKIQNALILDSMIPTLEELLNNDNTVTIYAPATKKGLAMAYDIIMALSSFYVRTSSFNVEVEGKTIHKEENNKQYKYNIIAKGKQSLETPEDKNINSNLYSPRGEGIQVRGCSIPKIIQERRKQARLPIFSSIRNHVPRPQYSTSLAFRYMGFSPFRVDLPLYNQKGIPYVKNSGKTVFDYPIASEIEIHMSNKAFRYIMEPIFWDAWSQYHAKSYDLFEGSTLQDLADRSNADLEKTKEHISKSLPYTLTYLNKDRIPADWLLENVNCPRKLKSVYLHKLFKAHNYARIHNKQEMDRIYEKLMVQTPPDLTPLIRAGFTEKEAKEIVDRAIGISKS